VARTRLAVVSVCLWDGWGWTVRGGDGGWTLDREDHPASDVPLLSSAPPAWATPGVRDRSRDLPSEAHAPKVVIPNRAYFLFHGTVVEIGDWGAVQVPGEHPADVPAPAFIWPADHAWCIANDVDPHWAGIGVDTATIDQLLADPRLDVVLADPREAQPEYR